MSENTTTKYDIKNRTFLLNEDVDAESVEKIILGIHEINRQDDEDEKSKVDFKRQPIKLVLDTNGGEFYRGMGLVNIIDSSKTDVHAYVYGMTASMGVIIAAICHKRFAHKRAHFMIHSVAAGTYGKLSWMEESVEQYKKIQEMMDDLLIENTNIKQKKLDKVTECKQDWFITGEEALEIGLVDELIEGRGKK